MRRTFLVVLVLLAAVCLPDVAAAQPFPWTVDPTLPPDVQQRLDAALGDAEKIRAAGQLAAARERLAAIAREAEQVGARRHQAAAFWSIGRIQSQENDRTAAKASFIRSRDLYRASGMKLGEAAATRFLGLMHYYAGEYATARELVEASIALYEEIHDVAGLAIAYNNLVYMYEGPEKDDIRQKALRYARESGDVAASCGVIHEWGDELFDRGDFIGARPKLLEALACFESVKEPDDIGRVLVSLGRLQRAHGQYPSALEYYQRALAIQQADGNPDLGAVQSLNAIGTIYMYMGQYDQVRSYFERGLAEARRLKSDNTVTFMIGQLGNYYLSMEQYQKAIELLEASVQPNQKAAHISYRHINLANAYNGLGNLAKAQEYADLAVGEARAVGPDSLVGALTARADIARKRGAYAAAERDLRESVALVEEVRAKTIPVDFMKRGYSDVVQSIYAWTIELQMEQRHWRAALETAEHARARAFLDLLASRTPPTTKAGTSAGAATNGERATASHASAANDAATVTREAPTAGASGMTTRGGAARDIKPAAAGAPETAPEAAAKGASSEVAAAGATTAPQSGSRGGGAALAGLPDVGGGPGGRAVPQLTLDSSRAATPADMAAMIATAKRLRSTLLAYWVGRQGVFVWVVSPAGAVHATRIDVPATRLETLVADAGQAVSTATGGGFALMGRAQTRPWRELYAVLIKPVRGYLPTAPNSLLTIVPHGPLFRVPFAALLDERDRYLVERYRVHYTPAIGVLQFTAQHQHTAPKQIRRALLIGDPGAVTPEPGGESMPALPWARREVDEIAAHLPAGASRVLVDAHATEAEVRSTLDGMDLVHFATHGVVRQQNALSSFLALRGDGEQDPARNGRLTAEEVYGLGLSARLVVLSACSTALGPMSGDGVIGFTRAFLYAGASSVIATEWDVPDEAGYELMRRFYRERAVSGRDSDALRSAQLGVIHSLRKGTLKVATPGGDVALPEHPLFWAGFVLVGEP